MFRHRHPEGEESAENLEVTGEEELDAAAAEAGETAASEDGPWDSDESYPELQRFDFGALRVPRAEGLEFHVNFEATEVDEEGSPISGRPVAVLVQYGESVLQLEVRAAPKRSGIWDDIRREISTEIQEQAQGQSQEREGPFGPELLATIPAPLTDEVLEQMPDEMREQIPAEVIEQGYAWQPLRFIGVDGPRWFLQGVVQGAAIDDEEQWQILEDVFRNIVVFRGEQPMPPRERLELRLPSEFQEASEQPETDEENGDDGPGFNPFERGPEITEVR